MTTQGQLSRRAVLRSAAALTVAAGTGVSTATHAAGKPVEAADWLPVIPQVQQWTAATGSFVLRTGSRVVTGAELAETGATVAEDLSDVAGFTVAPVTGASPVAGDIQLLLGSTDPQLGDEGYRLEIGPVVRIQARTARGAFYGTRTLLQLLRSSLSVPAGTVRDWPLYPERGLLIGNEAQILSMQWWQEQIRELAYLKLNMLWLYIGYARATVPDMQAVAAFARKYHVTVVPQLNMPGHMEGVLPGTGLHLQNPDRLQSLDLGDDAAYAWARNKLNELVPAIDSPYWHTGADEYMLFGDYNNWPHLERYAKTHYGPNAIPEDLEHGFVRMVNEVVRGHGRTLRMWNDGYKPGGAVQIDKNVVIEHWKPWYRQAADLLAEGYQVQNSHWKLLYYDTNGNTKLEAPRVYDEFKVEAFSDGSSVAPGHPGLRGAKIHVWISPPFPEVQMAATLFPAMRSLAQQTWGSPRNRVPDFAAFEPLIAATGHAPGTSQWLSNTTGLTGQAFVRDSEQHVLAAAGSAGGVLHWWYSDAVRRDSWSGPVLTGQPIGYQHGEQYHVFGRASDGSLVHWTGQPGNQPRRDNWGVGAGQLTSDPGGCSYVDQQHVFFRDPAGRLRHMFYDRSSRALGGDDWGGELEGRPVAYVFEDEQHVFGRGPDGSLRHWWYTPKQTSSPERDVWAPPGSVASGLAGFAYYDQQHVFFRNSANRLIHWYWDKSTGRLGSEDWGGELAGDPVAYVFEDEQHVFGRGPDGSLRHWWYAPEQSTSPARDVWAPAGSLTTDPAGFAYPNQQHVFYRGTDGKLAHVFWDKAQWRLLRDDWGG